MQNQVVAALEHCIDERFDLDDMLVEIKMIANYYVQVDNHLLEVTHLITYMDEDVTERNLLLAIKTRRLNGANYKSVVIGRGNPTLSHSTFLPLTGTSVAEKIEWFLEEQFAEAAEGVLLDIADISDDVIVLDDTRYSYTRSIQDSESLGTIIVHQLENGRYISDDSRRYIVYRAPETGIYFKPINGGAVTEDYHNELLEVIKLVWVRANRLM